MKIIGIDPGYAISGFGVIDYIGNSFKTIDYGVVRTPSQMDMPNRLKILYDSYI